MLRGLIYPITRAAVMQSRLLPQQASAAGCRFVCTDNQPYAKVMDKAPHFKGNDAKDLLCRLLCRSQAKQ